MRLRYLWLFFSVLGGKESQGFSNLNLSTQARLRCLGYLLLLSLRGLSSSSFVHHVVLNRFVQPIFGSTDTRDDIFSLLVEQVGPVCLFTERFSTPNDDESVLGASDPHVDPVLVLDEGARFGTNHRHEH